jgi:hypothetical protein
MKIYLDSHKDKIFDLPKTDWLVIPESKYNDIPFATSRIDGASIVTCNQEKFNFKKGAIVTMKNERTGSRYIDFDENDLIDLTKWPRI